MTDQYLACDISGVPTDKETLRRQHTRCILCQRHANAAYHVNAVLYGLLASHKSLETTQAWLMSANQNLGYMVDLHRQSCLLESAS